VSERAEALRRYLEIWNGTRDVDELDDLVTSSFVGHIGSRDRGLAELKDDVRVYRQNAGDVRFEVMHRFAEGDHVSTRLVAHSTDPATGAAVTFCGLNVSRWEDGLLAEEWAVWEPHPGGT
jgi:predicted ester cyclase